MQGGSRWWLVGGRPVGRDLSPAAVRWAPASPADVRPSAAPSDLCEMTGGAVKRRRPPPDDRGPPPPPLPLPSLPPSLLPLLSLPPPRVASRRALPSRSPSPSLRLPPVPRPRRFLPRPCVPLSLPSAAVPRRSPAPRLASRALAGGHCWPSAASGGARQPGAALPSGRGQRLAAETAARRRRSARPSRARRPRCITWSAPRPRRGPVDRERGRRRAGREALERIGGLAGQSDERARQIAALARQQLADVSAIDASCDDHGGQRRDRAHAGSVARPSSTSRRRPSGRAADRTL